jgi:hypothetical protein
MSEAAKLTDDAGIPAMIPSKIQHESLNPEYVWYLWVKTKSLESAAQMLKEVGIISPVTGRAYTRQALHLAAQKTPQYAEAMKKLKKDRKYFTTKTLLRKDK